MGERAISGRELIWEAEPDTGIADLKCPCGSNDIELFLIPDRVHDDNGKLLCIRLNDFVLVHCLVCHDIMNRHCSEAYRTREEATLYKPNPDYRE